MYGCFQFYRASSALVADDALGVGFAISPKSNDIYKCDGNDLYVEPLIIKSLLRS